jgi:hypothetical protein
MQLFEKRFLNGAHLFPVSQPNDSWNGFGPRRTNNEWLLTSTVCFQSMRIYEVSFRRLHRNEKIECIGNGHVLVFSIPKELFCYWHGLAIYWYNWGVFLLALLLLERVNIDCIDSVWSHTFNPGVYRKHAGSFCSCLFLFGFDVIHPIWSWLGKI